MTESAVEQFQKRIVRMMDEGCTMFHLSVGSRWRTLSIEEKCAATLEMWDAKPKPLDFKDSYGPRTLKPSVDIREFVKQFDTPAVSNGEQS